MKSKPQSFENYKGYIYPIYIYILYLSIYLSKNISICEERQRITFQFKWKLPAIWIRGSAPEVDEISQVIQERHNQILKYGDYKEGSNMRDIQEVD